jgi:hypothetical protein
MEQNPPQPKQPGIGTGFKLVIGGCLALAVIGIGGCVACGVIFQGINTNSSVNTPSQTSPITLTRFNNLSDGMTLSQVETTLGERGKLSSSSGNGKNKFEIYNWDAGTFKSVSCSFQGGKLTSKSQFGLE